MKDHDTNSQDPLPKNQYDNLKLDSDLTYEECDENENSVWDGSESEYIEDDDAAEYEEKYTGIKLHYSLKSNEIFDCLRKFSNYKLKQKKSHIQTSILIVISVLFLATGIIKNDTNAYIFFVASIILIAVIWLVPRIIINSHAKEISRNNEMYVEIYPDEIVVGICGIEKTILNLIKCLC